MILSHHTVSLIVMFASGIFFASILDIFRTFWVYHIHWKIYSFHRLFELALWLIFGIGTFYLLYLIKGGTWRFVDPLSQLLGMLFYINIAHKPFRFIGKILFLLIVKPSYWLGHLFVTFVRKVFRLIIKSFIKLVKLA